MQSSPSSPNIRLAAPFFMVLDMDIFLKFYTEDLGFTMTSRWIPRGKIEWCLLQRDDGSLMLQQPKDQEKFDQKGLRGNGVSVCFQCADALSLYHEFKSRGIEIDPPFVGNNMWLVCFNDPDGYRLDFESPTDVAEGTKYLPQDL